MPRDLNVPITDMKLVREQGYINGEWVDADSGETIEVTNKATGDTYTPEQVRGILAALPGFIRDSKKMQERAVAKANWTGRWRDRVFFLGFLLLLLARVFEPYSA